MRFSGFFYIVGLFLAIIIFAIEYQATGRYVSPYMVIPFIIAMLGYMFAPQIDWWWYKRFPMKLDPKVRAIFENSSTFYQNLSPEKKKLFENRIANYIEAKEWIHIGNEGDMPYDIKAIIAYQAVRLTLNMKDYLLSPFDRIVLYPNPFLSHQHPERYHASEIHIPDGVILLSLRHMMPAFRDPMRYFDIALYEYAKAFKHTVKDVTFPQIDENFFYNLYDVANYGHREIMGVVGLPDIDPFAVAVHHYFTYGEYFGNVYPELYDAFEAIFGTFHLPLSIETVSE